MENALQLYLIGGFLGSGKTTFLRNMLENMTDRKIGVLVNEFGDISIDGTVIRKEGMEMVELNNGSIFCACLKDSFVKTLKMFADSDIDALVVENSGMADPGGMPQILAQLAPYCKRPYDYRGLICLCDSTTFLDYVDLLNPLQHQVQMADFIIVNKTDLVDREVVDAIHETIRFYNDAAEIYDTVYATVPMDLLDERLENHGVVIEGECCCNKKENRPATYTLSSDSVLTVEQVSKLCEYLGKYALRVKGFFHHAEGGWVHSDCVGKQINVKDAADDMEIMLETGKLVIIGNSPDEFEDAIMFAWERYCGGHYELVCTK